MAVFSRRFTNMNKTVHSGVFVALSLSLMTMLAMGSAIDSYSRQRATVNVNETLGLVGGNNYEVVTTAGMAIPPLFIALVTVAVSIVVLIFVYILVVKFLCQDTAAVLSISSLDLKKAGRLKSASSIKTLNSTEAATLRGQSANAVVVAEPKLSMAILKVKSKKSKAERKSRVVTTKSKVAKIKSRSSNNNGKSPK